MLLLLPAAFIAVAMHALPTVAIAFPQTTSTSQCLTSTDCLSLVTDMTACGVSDFTATITDSQAACLCATKGFVTAAASCLTCMGQDGSLMSSACSSLSVSSAVSSRPATSQAATTKATSTTKASASATSPAQSTATCDNTSECIVANNALSDCGYSSGDLTATQMQCVCTKSGFKSNAMTCMTCLGGDATVFDACDGYSTSGSSSSGFASVKSATSSAGATSTTTGGTIRTTTPTGLTGGLRSSTGAAASNGIPALTLAAVFGVALLVRLM